MVYASYYNSDFVTQEKRSTLPIFSFREEILKLVAGHQIIIVSGETGWYAAAIQNKASSHRTTYLFFALAVVRVHKSLSTWQKRCYLLDKAATSFVLRYGLLNLGGRVCNILTANL
jgi:hypothetical protein